MKTRKVNGFEVELNSSVEIQESTPRCKRCKRAYMDLMDGGALRCYATPHTGPFGDVYERDDWKQVSSADCDECGEFDPRGLPFPMDVSDILFDEPEVRKPLGAEIGSTVVVRPCDPAFGGKTYLGVLVGETPTQIGLKYDQKRKELIVSHEWFNPMIVIPSERAVVYGYESWWRVASEEDLRELSDITDEEILSQPYMAALVGTATDG